jgi:hypothetical protein
MRPEVLMVTLFFPIGIALMGLLTIFMTNASFGNLDIRQKDYVEKEKLFRDTFDQMAGLIALLIAGAVFSNKPLIDTMNEQLCKSCTFLPDEFGYVYGLIFSLFLAVVYFPILFHFSIKNQEFIKYQVNILPPEEQDKGREQYEKQLKIHATTGDRLKTLFATTAPLLGSVLPEFFSFFQN